MKEWFEEWFDSPYYHLLYQNRSEHEAIDFAKNIIQHLKPALGSTLLDLACGKGRHARAFADLGMDVTGVDLSPQSIEFAKQSEHDRLHFYTHDMRFPFRSNYFDIVCNLFTSFGYFNTPHDNVLAATTIFSSLKPGGHFVFDFVNQAHARKNIDANPHEVIQHGDVLFTIQRGYTPHQLQKQIQIQDKQTTLNYTERVNSFSLEEIKTLFQQRGLHHLETFGDYHLNDYEADQSPRMILVFEK
jgi:SAM-dependent methyltransferase